jgi:hypothetical protein
MGFDDFDVEISDDVQSEPEHFNGTIATTADTTQITPSSGRSIQNVRIEIPGILDPDDPQQPTLSIKFSVDGTNYAYIRAGEVEYFGGVFTTLYLKTSSNGGKYRVIVWS